MVYPPPPSEPPPPGQGGWGGTPGNPGNPGNRGDPGAVGAPGPPPAYVPGAGPYGYPPAPRYAPPAPTLGKATASLVLGVLSLVSCGLLTGIPAMILGRQSQREIEASHGGLGGEGLARAGFITGLIGTIISGLALLAVIGLFAFGAMVATSTSDCPESPGDSYSGTCG